MYFDKIDEENDFIKNNCGLDISENMIKAAVVHGGNRFLLANVIKKAKRKEKITICTFGGSVTGGSIYTEEPSADSGIKHSLSHKPYGKWVCDWWQEVFCSDVELVNAGIGATDTVFSIHRMQEDVLDKKPDMVILDWCVNDAPEMLYKQSCYEYMVRQLLERGIAVIMFSFTEITGRSSQDLHEPIAKFYNVPMLSCRSSIFTLPQYKYLLCDHVHPNCVGHALAGLLINSYIGEVVKDEELWESEYILPQKVLFEDTKSYENPRILKLMDIYEGKIDGARIVDMGSFEIEDKITLSGYRNYRAFVAGYSESYKPLVIEAEGIKNLFLQIYRNSVFLDTNFYLVVNGKEIRNKTFTCMHGVDNNQIEWDYTWATEKVLENKTKEKLRIEIYPECKNPDKYIKIISLLVS